MGDNNQKTEYPKQETKPDRKPSESVTWVRNQEKNEQRKVIYVPKPAYIPKRRP